MMMMRVIILPMVVAALMVFLTSILRLRSIYRKQKSKENTRKEMQKDPPRPYPLLQVIPRTGPFVNLLGGMVGLSRLTPLVLLLPGLSDIWLWLLPWIELAFPLSSFNDPNSRCIHLLRILGGMLSSFSGRG